MTDVVSPRKTGEIFAETVRAARARRRWTQSELAQRAGVGRDRISEIETGVLDPRLSEVDLVASALGIELTIVERAA